MSPDWDWTETIMLKGKASLRALNKLWSFGSSHLSWANLFLYDLNTNSLRLDSLSVYLPHEILKDKADIPCHIHIAGMKIKLGKGETWQISIFLLKWQHQGRRWGDGYTLTAGFPLSPQIDRGRLKNFRVLCCWAEWMGVVSSVTILGRRRARPPVTHTDISFWL